MRLEYLRATRKGQARVCPGLPLPDPLSCTRAPRGRPEYVGACPYPTPYSALELLGAGPSM